MTGKSQDSFFVNDLESSSSEIEALVARLRRGDEAAARQFVAAYEPFIRRAIRQQIRRFNLRAAVDTADVCQSVLGGLLIRLALGKFHLASSADIQRLLLGITRNKIAQLVRREYADRRDRNRHASLVSDYDPPAAAQNEPQQQVIQNDLLEQIKSRLEPAEQELLTLRLAGHDWQSIEVQLGVSQVLLRQRLSRALRRVTTELDLG